MCNTRTPVDEEMLPNLKALAIGTPRAESEVIPSQTDAGLHPSDQRECTSSVPIGAFNIVPCEDDDSYNNTRARNYPFDKKQHLLCALHSNTVQTTRVLLVYDSLEVYFIFRIGLMRIDLPRRQGGNPCFRLEYEEASEGYDSHPDRLHLDSLFWRVVNKEEICNMDLPTHLTLGSYEHVQWRNAKYKSVGDMLMQFVDQVAVLLEVDYTYLDDMFTLSDYTSDISPDGFLDVDSYLFTHENALGSPDDPEDTRIGIKGSLLTRCMTGVGYYEKRGYMYDHWQYERPLGSLSQADNAVFPLDYSMARYPKNAVTQADKFNVLSYAPVPPNPFRLGNGTLLPIEGNYQQVQWQTWEYKLTMAADIVDMSISDIQRVVRGGSVPPSTVWASTEAYMRADRWSNDPLRLSVLKHLESHYFDAYAIHIKVLNEVEAYLSEMKLYDSNDPRISALETDLEYLKVQATNASQYRTSINDPLRVFLEKTKSSIPRVKREGVVVDCVKRVKGFIVQRLSTLLCAVEMILDWRQWSFNSARLASYFQFISFAEVTVPSARKYYKYNANDPPPRRRHGANVYSMVPIQIPNGRYRLTEMELYLPGHTPMSVRYNTTHMLKSEWRWIASGRDDEASRRATQKRVSDSVFSGDDESDESDASDEGDGDGEGGTIDDDYIPSDEDGESDGDGEGDTIPRPERANRKRQAL